MKTILIEHEIYKVTEREFQVITKMEKEIKDAGSLHHSIGFALEDKLHRYLETSKVHYRLVGIIDYQYRGY